MPMASLFSQTTVTKLTNPSRERSAEVHRFKEHRAFAVRQDYNVWCWLACAEMIHRHQNRLGTEFTQAGLAARISGIEESPNGASAQAGALMAILGALSPKSQVSVEGIAKMVANVIMGETPVLKSPLTVDPIGTGIWLAKLADPATDLIIDEISKNRPVVALLKPLKNGEMGHAVVLYQVTWVEGGPGWENLIMDSKRRQIKSVLVADPWREEWVTSNSSDGAEPPRDVRKRIESLTGEELKVLADRFLSEQYAKELFEGLNQALNLKTKK